MDDSRPAKRPRLSMACNECRRRKVKCDANYPQCRNCAQRKLECITTDPKRPGATVAREWVEDKLATAPNQDQVVTATKPILRDPPYSVPRMNSNTQIPPVDVATARQESIDHAEVSETSPRNGPPSEQQSSSVSQPSPVYNPYDMSFNLDHNTNRIKMLGPSSAQCLIKSLDVYLELARVKPVAPSLKYGMRHSEELVIPLAVSLPSFPEVNARQRYIRAFFKRIHPIWPVVDIDDTKSTVHALALVSNLSTVPHEQVPLLAIAYLVISLGADEDARQVTDDGTTYLKAAASLLGHCMLMPYLTAIQALVLFTIAYRGRNQDGLAWQTAGIAVRIAHSLGLHKHSAIRPSKEHGVTEKRTQLYHARNWAVCCCLEKIIQLESGRPSAIDHLDQDQMMVRDQRAPGPDFLQWNMGLAVFQNDIGQHVYGRNPGDRTAKDILQNIARLDRGLLAWANQIPHEFQPENAMFCSNEDIHFVAFLAVQFHEALITLHRAALIAPRGMFDAEVEKYCSEEPSRYRLQRGELICINSARTIIRLTLELAERKAESRIMNVVPSFLAAVALAVFLMKHPRGRSQAADLELLKAAVEHISDEYTKCGMDRRMAQGVVSIYDKVRSHFRYNANIQKRAQGDNGANRPPQAHTPSSRTGETVSVDDSLSAGSPMVQRPASAPYIGPGPDYRHPAKDSGRLYIPNNHVSPNNINVDGDNIAVSENLASRKDMLGPANGWTPTAVHPDLQNQHHFIAGTNEGLVDALSIGQEAPGGLGVPGRLPFGEFNVEEMWDWMCQIDSTENFPTVASFPPPV